MEEKNTSAAKVNICPQCDIEVEPGLKFCTSCGSEITVSGVSSEETVCPKCYADVEPGLKFCTSCGSEVGVSSVSSQETVCPQCYADIPPGQKFCTECGSSMIKSGKFTTSQISQKLKEKRKKEGRINPPDDEILESAKTTGKSLMKGLGGFMNKAASEVDKGLNKTEPPSNRKPRNITKPGYLVCDSCEGYYKLQKGENPDDFMDECECGGKYIHKRKL